MSALRTLLISLQAAAQDLSVPDLIEAVLERSGYVESLEAERTIESQGRMENLQELVGVGREYLQQAQEPSLSGFLQEISLYSDQDAIRGEQSLVTLMTLHNAKGLEFKAVFMIGDGGGDLPAHPLDRGAGRRGGAPPRLRRNDPRAGAPRAHPRDLALALGQPDVQPAVALPRRAARGGRRQRTAAPASWSGYGARDVTPRDDVPDLSTGDSVRHGTLGEGVVVRVEPGGVVTVRFAEDGAERQAHARICPLGEDRMIEVRPCTSTDELRDAAGAITHYFARERPTEEWAERWLRNFELERMHAAVDDGKIVGGAGAFSFMTTVPGGASVPCAGRDDRRRAPDPPPPRDPPLDDARPARRRARARRADRDPLRLGGDDLRPVRLRARLAQPQRRDPEARNAFRPGVEPVGRVRFVEADEAAKLFPAVYDAVRRVPPGMFVRTRRLVGGAHARTTRPSFAAAAGPKHFVVHEVDGEAQGYVIYRLSGEWGDFGPDSAVRAIEVVAATPEATVALWRFLLDIDWTKSANTFLMPVDHPLFLLLARPNYARPTLGDGLWCRLVDVGAALSARTYAGDDAVVLDVRDEFCPWNEGRWRSRAARPRARRTRRTWRSTSPISARSTSARSRSATLVVWAASRSFARGRSTGPTRFPHGRRALVPGDLLSTALHDPL